MKKLIKFAKHGIIYLGALIMVLPFLWMVSTSLKQPSEIFTVPIQWIPKSLYIQNYIMAVRSFPFFSFFKNTAIVTVGILFLQILTSLFSGYAFARLEFRGKNFLFLLLLSAMMLPSQSIMVPMVQILQKLHLSNTLQGIIIPFGWSAMITFLFRQFFLGIPREIEEAAQIDGCGTLSIIFRIVVPLSTPIISTATIMVFVYAWNQYFWPLLILQDERYYTLQLGLSYFKEQSAMETNWGALMAATTLVIIPVIVVYVVFQKKVIQSIAFSGGKE